jgi:Fe-S cluster assembly iron-binding protein IscA
VNSPHSESSAQAPPPLALTPAAEEAIRAKLTEVDGEELFAFFVVTKPSRLGYNVGVGFELQGGERPLRPEYAVPIQIDDGDVERLHGTTIDYREDRFVTFTNVSVRLAETPNPDSRKFILNRELVNEGSATFAQPPREDDPLLVQYLLEIPGVKSLFFIRNFCTATKIPGAEWPDLQAEITRRLQAYFAHGGARMTPPPQGFGEVTEAIN